MNDCTDNQPSDSEISDYDASTRSARYDRSRAHEAVLVPSNKPDKRKSVDINMI